MTDDISDIESFYSQGVQYEHHRLERHQLEFDLTWRVLVRCLPPKSSILEVGAATGRYTLPLAQHGHRVTAVDLSPALLDENRRILTNTGLQDQVQWISADARDLSLVTQTAYDAALLMGPLYHLIYEDDRRAALQQAYDRLHPGGWIFSAFISRFGILGDLLKNVPEWIEAQEEVRSILDHGRDPDHLRGSGFRGYFATVSEIAPLHESLGFETVSLMGVEPAISADDESYNCLEGDRRRQWMDLLEEISSEPSTLGASRHLLYVGRKR